MKNEISALLKKSVLLILDRFENNNADYPFIDTKFEIVSGRDFGEADQPFYRKECVYSWIQGRGLESLAKHICYFRDAGEEALCCRLTAMLKQVAQQLECMRKNNGGRLPFAMNPDGSPFFPKESGNANFSDLFYSKGLFAAARVAGCRQWEVEAERLFTFVLDEIEAGKFHTDQHCFDPKNKVTFIPGKYPQGPRMIALGGLSDLIAARPMEPRWRARAENFINFILEHHVNRGQVEKCRRWDFIESVDGGGNPWYDGETLFSDPGHALEFVGLSCKCLLALRRQQCGESLTAEAGKSLPQLFTHVFGYGFNGAAGGIVKGFDLNSRSVLNSDMPWWSLPETVRAGMELSALFPDAVCAREIALCTGRAYQAMMQGFLQPNGFCCQTLDERGKIIGVIPAVPDADPGYHTNLSLIDVLKLLEA